MICFSIESVLKPGDLIFFILFSVVFFDLFNNFFFIFVFESFSMVRLLLITFFMSIDKSDSSASEQIWQNNGFFWRSKE